MNLIRFKKYLTEAKFSERSLKKVEKLITRVLARKTGMRWYRVPGIEHVISGGKRKFGIRYYLGSTLRSVRINWTRQTGAEIHSIDIWGEASPIEKPLVTVDLRGKNIVQIVNFLAKTIKQPRIGVFDVAIGESVIEEARGRKMGQEALEFIKFKQITPEEFSKNRIAFQTEFGRFKRTRVKEGTSTVIVGQGKPEKPLEMDDPVIRTAEKIIDKPQPNELFDQLEDLIDLVIKGIQPSLLVTGQAGSGKSFTVRKKIERSGLAKGKDFIIIKGTSSPLGLYASLFRHRTKLILYDDTDSILKDDKAMNILKAALDSEPVREISWFSKTTLDIDPDDLTDEDIAAGKLPSTFEFTGRIIFISNLPESKMDRALISRSFTIEISLAPNEILDRIESVINQISPEIAIDIKRETLTIMRETFFGTSKEISMRTFIKAARIIAGGSPRARDIIKFHVK